MERLNQTGFSDRKSQTGRPLYQYTITLENLMVPAYYLKQIVLFVCRRLPANEKKAHLGALCASVVRTSCP